MKSTIKTAFMSAMIAGTALVSVASIANAGGFSVREQSAEGQGASFAGIAAGGSDLSSMFFNPATITLHEGIQAEGDAALILPYAKAKNGVTTPGGLGGPSSGNIGNFAAVPSNYASYQFSDNLFVGFSANSPFGLVTKGNQTWAGSFHGVRSDLFMIQAGPTVGYKVNDMISFGASIRGVYSRVILTQFTGATVAKIKGKDWGVNYSVGMLLSPTDSTRIGVGYNSQTKLKYDGVFRVGGAVAAPVTAKLTTPGTLTVGLRQEVTDDITLLAGFEWADWSKLKNLTVNHKVFGVPIAPPVVFNWKDSFFYSVGGEYKFSDATTLRAGVAYEKSPVPDATRGVRVPDNDRIWLSIGASHQVNEKLRISAGYSHIFVKDGTVALAPGGGLPGISARFKQSVDIVSISGTYKLDSLFH